MENVSTLNSKTAKATVLLSKEASRLFLELAGKAQITGAEAKHLAELYEAAQYAHRQFNADYES